jgi:flagellar motor protein MotB
MRFAAVLRHKSQKPDSLIRQVRLERRSKVKIENDDLQGWAVSYSDMLMVLMSFFVIFFSFEEKKREGLISKIALEMSAKAGQEVTSMGTGMGKSSVTEVGMPAKSLVTHEGAVTTIDDLAPKLVAIAPSVVSARTNDYLVVSLSDQVYANRQFEVKGPVKQELERVLEALDPYRDAVRITFIGHTDNVKIANRNAYLSNNQDLSSLRAARALTFASERGFDPRFLSSEAAGPHGRGSRSLSLKVEVRSAQ